MLWIADEREFPQATIEQVLSGHSSDRLVINNHTWERQLGQHARYVDDGAPKFAQRLTQAVGKDVRDETVLPPRQGRVECLAGWRDWCEHPTRPIGRKCLHSV